MPKTKKLVPTRKAAPRQMVALRLDLKTLQFIDAIALEEDRSRSSVIARILKAEMPK
jgi:hypothetical protein